jgi:hypothetical protein
VVFGSCALVKEENLFGFYEYPYQPFDELMIYTLLVIIPIRGLKAD